MSCAERDRAVRLERRERRRDEGAVVRVVEIRRPTWRAVSPNVVFDDGANSIV